MKYTVRILMLTMALLPVMAAAQIQSNRTLEVKVPFDFAIGSKTIPPGKLTVKRIAVIDGPLGVYNSDARTSMVANFNRVEADTPATTTALVFHKYGQRYFLWRVKVEGSLNMYELPRSSAEAELLARNVPAEEILLAMK